MMNPELSKKIANLRMQTQRTILQWKVAAKKAASTKREAEKAEKEREKDLEEYKKKED